MPLYPTSSEGWTPALVHTLEPPVLALEEDYQQRLELPAKGHRVVLALGGIAVEVSTNSAGVDAYLRDAFGAFVIETEPVVRLELAQLESDFPFRTLVGSLMTYTRDSHVIGKFREMSGFIDTASRHGRGVVLGHNYRQDVGNYLRFVVGAMTPRLDAVLFHSAAIAHRGHAWLFFGPSTAGKSTLSKLSARNHEIMTDDMLILRFTDDGLRAATCGFWGGETKAYPSRRLDLPVKGLFRLAKGPENRLDTVPPATRSFELVCGIPSLNRSLDDHRFILDFAERAARAVPFHTLRFHKRDDSFWELLDALDREA